MNRYAPHLVALAALAGTAHAADLSGTTLPAAAPFSKTATLRMLDKQNNRAERITAEAGKTVAWGELTLTLHSCAWNIGGVEAQDTAWLDVAAAPGEPEFHGWMFNTFPSVAAYDHPRYNIELEGCVRPAGYTPVVAGRTAPATPAGPEHAGSDDEAPTGGYDAYAVPGVVDEAPDGGPAEANPAPLMAPGPAYAPEPIPEGDQQELQRMMDMR